MHISSIRISNYGSYANSETAHFEPGINFVTGRNNVGKSGLLKALRLRIDENEPHRSPLSVPSPDALVDETSVIHAELAVTPSEVFNHLRGKDFQLPIPAPGMRFGKFEISANPSADELAHVVQHLMEKNELTMRIEIRKNEIAPATTPSYAFYPANLSHTPHYYCFIASVRGENEFSIGGREVEHNPRGRDFGVPMLMQFRESIYHFPSERFTPSSCEVGPDTFLCGNASNLAEVLANLQTIPSRLMAYNDLVRSILPQVGQVTVRNLANRQLEVIIWPDYLLPRHSQRIDLAVPLERCGTGVGQILAICYVLLTSTSPRTILIDEPSSFLHPGAVRRLMGVISDHPQHQYIIATHSSTVVSSASSMSITMITHSDYQSHLTSIDSADNSSLRIYLREIGASLADVFGSDSILWVEGPTEEQSFPAIARAFCGEALRGTAIVGVTSTGDFNVKHAKKTLDIYKRLCKGGGLLPPAIGFLFDRETESETKLKELERESNGLMRFIPRRLFENYLLNPSAITHIMNGDEGFVDKQVERSQVADWLEQARLKQEYYQHTGYKIEPQCEDWVKYVDGANLLAHAFRDLSGSTVEFRKTEHSVALALWILENSPEELAEIGEMLMQFLSKGDG